MFDERPLLGDAQIQHGQFGAELFGFRLSRVFGPKQTIPDPIARQLQDAAQILRWLTVSVDVYLFQTRRRMITEMTGALDGRAVSQSVRQSG